MSLVDEQPQVKAVNEALADLARRRAEFEARAAALADADAEAQRAYEAAVNSALLQGTPMPPPLVLQLRDGVDVEIRYGFFREEEQLTEQRRLAAAAAAYPDVLAAARSQAAKFAKAARPAVEKLSDTMRDVGELLAAVRVCRDAENTDPNRGRRQYHDSRLSVEAFRPLCCDRRRPDRRPRPHRRPASPAPRHWHAFGRHRPADRRHCWPGVSGPDGWPAVTPNVRGRDWTAAQHRAVSVLLATGSTAKAGQAAGVSERTLRRWRVTAEFLEALRGPGRRNAGEAMSHGDNSGQGR